MLLPILSHVIKDWEVTVVESLLTTECTRILKKETRLILPKPILFIGSKIDVMKTFVFGGILNHCVVVA